ncbi:MAG: dihydrofolate reductase [Defluviitaleaceae bacterium]|nr:dihydrofolate reductase [Defluviitaleaceae bacterium]
MNAIVNVDENWGIGLEGDQPFYIPGDLRFFRDKTRGKVVVMGRSTLNALPNSAPLKERTNIVLSRQEDFEVQGAVHCKNLDELFEAIKDYDTNDVFIIGGAKLYGDLLRHCTYVYVTKIFSTAPCDRFFPNLDDSPDWVLVEASEIKKFNNLKYQFCTYANRRGGALYGN